VIAEGDFAAACARALGHHFPASDRELAMAALGVMLARTPRGGPLDAMLRSFVVAAQDLVGRVEARDVPREIEAKKQVLRKLLSVDTTRVVVDMQADGVVCPHLLRRRDLGLDLGYGMPRPIPELEAGESFFEGDVMSITLSFGGVPTALRIPWAAVWAMHQKGADGVCWPQAAPPGAGVREPDPAPRVASSPEAAAEALAQPADELAARRARLKKPAATKRPPPDDPGPRCA
jgi:hypothetical protein